MKTEYIFISKRLGFRNWIESDLDKLSDINSNEEVMKFFPQIQSRQDTKMFIERMQIQFRNNGFCYFAVEVLEDHRFIGFIGLSKQTYPADFTPCIDIGWRLIPKEWNKGFATEGATRCLKYGFDKIGLDEIFSTAPIINKNSEKIMLKIGMKIVKTFDHPLLTRYPKLKKCNLFKISRSYRF